MAACNVYRDKEGNITKVTAPNEQESILFASLTSSLGGDKEKALRAWAQAYTPTFKEEFGDWELFNKAKSLGFQVGGLYKDIFKDHEEEALFEAAVQGNSSADEKSTATKIFGEDIMKIASQLFPNAKVSGSYKSRFEGKLDKNGEPLASQVKMDRFKQLRGTEGSVASAHTLGRIKEFLKRIGVAVDSLQNVVVEGNKLGANGVADILAGVISIAEGKEDIALPEEAMHFAVELIQQKNPELFKQMFNKIGSYELYKTVLQDYKDVYKNPDGSIDVPRVKKETIARVLVETIINKNEGSKESEVRLLQTKSWWGKFVEWFKGLMSVAKFNPFNEVADKILSGEEELGTAKDLTKEGVFYQLSNNLIPKLAAENEKIGKNKAGRYERDGVQVKSSVEEAITKFYDNKRNNQLLSEDETKRAIREYKEATVGKGSADIQDILGRYINQDGKLRETALAVANPSALSANRAYYNTLEKSMAQRLQSYPAGTTFMHDTKVYDDKRGIVGNIDLLALRTDGKVDVLQFKFPTISGKNGTLRSYEQTAYNTEVEELRKILEHGYGLDKKDFGLTRAIPVRAYYVANVRGDLTKGVRLANLKIGSVDVSLEKDDNLLPVASASESTGNKELDKLLVKLRGVLENMQNEKVLPAEAEAKATRVVALQAAIRKLQVQRDSSALLESVKTIVKRSNDIYTALSKSVEGANPQELTIAEIASLSDRALRARKDIDPYKDLDLVFERIYEKTQEEMIAPASEIARKSTRLIREFEDLEDKIRTDIYATKVGIKDELNPEKALTWYRRMIRSLSQSSTKAGQLLWSLVKNINERLAFEYADRIHLLEHHAKEVNEWANGKGGIQAVYKKILAYDEKGRWKGRFISKTSKDFYDKLNEAKKKGDLTWVKDNIDVEAYNKWYQDRYAQKIESNKTLRLSPDDEANEKLIDASLRKFEEMYDITKKSSIHAANYALNAFPKAEAWSSKEYSELQKADNEPLLKLYNYWQDVLEASHEAGLIANFERRTFFPNIRKEYLEKEGAARLDVAGSLLNGLRIDNQDSEFGKQDPLTGEPIDSVHAAFVYDLGKEVMDTDGSYFKDYSEKSMDIFKAMALWERELIRFNLRTESEGIAKLLASTEGRKKAFKVNRIGNLVKDQGEAVLIDNNTNTKYIQEFIDAIYYNKRLSDEFDVTVNIPYKGAVEKINKLFGKEIFTVPEEEKVTVSGIKALQSMNRYFVMKTLGVNPLTALSQLFGGTANAYINSGKFFTKKDLLEAQTKMVSGKFWDKDGKIQAGLIQYFMPSLEDQTYEKANELSVNKAVKYLSSEHLMFMQRGADKVVQIPIFLAFAANTMIKDGQLVNIRDYVKEREGYASIYSLPYDEQVAKKEEVEKKIEALKESSGLLKASSIVDDKLVMPGIERGSQTVLDFRQKVLEYIKDALGNTSREDLSLYKRSVMMQSFFMFKNWIPRMLDVRGQSLKYNAGTDTYEWGRLRMLANGLRTNGLSTISSLFKQLSGNDKNIIEIAKKLYQEKREYFANQQEDFNMSEADFVDMYIKGVRSEFKELAVTVALVGILIAARANAPKKDDDPQIKGMYKWSLRAVDKLTDELSFFYDPKSFTDIANGSVFPAVNILVDSERLLKAATKDAYYHMVGDEQGVKQTHVAKYLFKSLPITKELATYIAIFNNDMAKQYGIQISSQNGQR